MKARWHQLGTLGLRPTRPPSPRPSPAWAPSSHALAPRCPRSNDGHRRNRPAAYKRSWLGRQKHRVHGAICRQEATKKNNSPRDATALGGFEAHATPLESVPRTSHHGTGDWLLGRLLEETTPPREGYARGRRLVITEQGRSRTGRPRSSDGEECVSDVPGTAAHRTASPPILQRHTPPHRHRWWCLRR